MTTIDAARASQRATARLIGVHKETIREDLGRRTRPGGNPPTTDKTTRQNQSEPEVDGGNPPAWFQREIDPARAATRVTLAEAIADAERTLARLRQQAEDELVTAIAIATASTEFSARELWQHTRYVEGLAPPLRARFAALRDAIETAGITSAVQLGKFLRRVHVNGVTFEQIGTDNTGRIWTARTRA